MPGLKVNIVFKIGVISVTYKTSIISTELYKSLLKIDNNIPENFIFYNFCNSYKKVGTPQFFYEEYSFENGGLALGYNKGLDYFSKNSDVKFILFLNSDCKLNLKIFNKYLQNQTLDYDFIYPNLFSNRLKISPFRKISFDYNFFIISWLFIKKEVFEHVRFPQNFWLDGIDYFLSEYLNKNNFIGYNMKINIQHHLSISNDYKNTPDWRILNIYKSEKIFNYRKNVFRFLLLKGILKSFYNFRFGLTLKLFKLF